MEQRRSFEKATGGYALRNTKINHSVFVEGFPERASGIWLRNMFKESGVVTDVFIPNKRAKSGNRFAFIRYKLEWEAEQAIHRNNGRMIAGKRLVVNFANMPRNNTVWKRKDEEVNQVNADKAGESQQHYVKRVEVVEDESIKDMLTDCIVGTVRESVEVGELLSSLKKEGLEEVWITRISDFKYIIGFHDDVLKEEMKKNEWRKLDKWFSGVEPWRPDIESANRVVKLRISGLPLPLWNNRNLAKISECWGKMCDRIRPEHLSGNSRNCFVMIETKAKRIDEVIELQMGAKVAKVWVTESLIGDESIGKQDGDRGSSDSMGVESSDSKGSSLLCSENEKKLREEEVVPEKMLESLEKCRKGGAREEVSEDLRPGKSQTEVEQSKKEAGDPRQDESPKEAEQSEE